VELPGFNVLKNQFGSRGFELVAFPCAQFANQEPGANSEIMNEMKYVRPGNGYVPNFPFMAKLDVNGQNEAPLYTFLKSRCPPSQWFLGDPQDLMWDPYTFTDVPWNYEKFLIDKKGQPFKRYNPVSMPYSLAADIDALLSQ